MNYHIPLALIKSALFETSGVCVVVSCLHRGKDLSIRQSIVLGFGRYTMYVDPVNLVPSTGDTVAVQEYEYNNRSSYRTCLPI
jgi:hypothetical protein